MPILDVDEVQEAMIEDVELRSSGGERDWLLVPARFRDHELVPVRQGTPGRVQQANPVVLAAVDHHVLHRPRVTEQVELVVAVEQFGDGGEGCLRLAWNLADGDDLPLFGGLERLRRPMVQIETEVRKCLIDDGGFVAARDLGPTIRRICRRKRSRTASAAAPAVGPVACAASSLPSTTTLASAT